MAGSPSRSNQLFPGAGVARAGERPSPVGCQDVRVRAIDGADGDVFAYFKTHTANVTPDVDACSGCFSIYPDTKNIPTT